MSVQSEIKFRCRKKAPVVKKDGYEDKVEVYYTRRSARNGVRPSLDYEDVVKQRSPRKSKYTEHNDSVNCDITENITPSPPKIKCNLKLNSTSPSSLLQKLHLTPKNGSIEPINLFPDVKSSFQSVKKALHSSAPEEMPGRESEITHLTNFLEEHLEDKNSGSIYISGPPGTGKTATLNHILQKSKYSYYKQVYLNCTSMKSSVAIYAHIVEALNLKSPGRTERDNILCLEKYFESSKRMTLLVLDEIDQLESRKQSVLYTIFEWPARFKSGIVLIGIANALDLTDRILPRLHSHASLKPELMHFAPYKKEQIVQIITKRLEDANVLTMFASGAIQILAAKVAAVSGDVRRALDIGRRAVELAEQHRKNNALQLNHSTNIDNQVPKIELKDVLAVLNNVFATSQNLGSTIEEAFPLQQKIVLCSLILMLRKAKNKDITVGKLHDVYKRVCGKRNILAVDQTEFVSLLSLIETRGILRRFGKKDVRLHKICLEWDEDEIVNVMKDKNLMASILDDVNCLGLK